MGKALASQTAQATSVPQCSVKNSLPNEKWKQFLQCSLSPLTHPVGLQTLARQGVARSRCCDRELLREPRSTRLHRICRLKVRTWQAALAEVPVLAVDTRRVAVVEPEPSGKPKLLCWALWSPRSFRDKS